MMYILSLRIGVLICLQLYPWQSAVGSVLFVSCDFPGAEVLDLLLQREPSGKSFKRVLLTCSSSGFKLASTWDIECKTIKYSLF